jgi:signal transduction histidine kinase
VGSWSGYSIKRLDGWAVAAVWTAIVVFGLLSESVAFGWEDFTSWLPDLVVGLVFVWCGMHAASRNRGTAALLVAFGLLWFVANVWAPATFIHRGVLVHLLVVYPGWRPRSRLETIAVVVGYAASAFVPVWRQPVAAVILAVLVTVALAGRVVVSTRRTRSARRTALWAGGSLSTLIIVSAVVRPAVGDTDATTVVSLLYQAVLCGVAVAVTFRLPAGSSVVDLVVELGGGRSGTLRDALAATIGASSLEVGYWDQRTAYRDAGGRVVQLPPAGGARSVTFIGAGSKPAAVLVHDASVLREPVLVESVAVAARLSTVNADLQAVVNAQLDELTASRRRLVTTADRERRGLDRRLHEGAERRLEQLELVLRREVAGGGVATARLDAALEQLAETIDDLHQLAAGLHPRVLDAGLAPALRMLAAGVPLRVELDVRGEPAGVESRTAVYYVCAEALANTAKHAAAMSAVIVVTAIGDCVEVRVADDGVGGATVAGGSGLRGLIDRVEALGGTLRLDSPAGVGTRLVVKLPTSEGAGGP